MLTTPLIYETWLDNSKHKFLGMYKRHQCLIDCIGESAHLLLSNSLLEDILVNLQIR